MSKKIRLVVSVDTEEDNWHPVPRGLTAANLYELPRLDAAFGRLGVRATYFVTYQVAIRAWVAGLLRDLVAGGRAEIGAHLHPWDTPPFDADGPRPPTMLNTYTLEAQRAKLANLTDALTAAFGERPTVFRAGRFGLGTETVRALIEQGYRVDSSVTPFLDWSRYDDGPSFVAAPISAYHLDGSGDVCTPVRGGPLAEIPLSAGYTRFPVSTWPRLGQTFRRPVVRRLRIPSLAARTGLVRRAILSPETNSVADMLAVSRRLLAGGATHLHLFFHSSSLRPGLTPFVNSRADLRDFYDRLERFVEGLTRLGPVSFLTVGELARELEAGHPLPRAPGGLSGTAYARARPAPPRLLVVNYHHVPDGSVGGLRWAGLGKYLSRQGWEVHLLTGARSAGPGVREGVQVHVTPRFITTNDLYRVMAGAVRGALARLSGKSGAPPVTAAALEAPARPTGFWRRLRWEAASLLSFPDEGRGWILRAAWETRRLVRRFRPDVVVASGPPHSAHIAAALALLGRDVPLVLDMRDPWSTRLGAWRFDPVYGTDAARFLIRHLERWVFRQAPEVIANTRELADLTRQRNPQIKVSWVRNGVDLDDLPPATGAPFPGLAVCYVGTLYGSRSVQSLFDAFRLFLEAHPRARADGSRVRIAGFMEPERRQAVEARLQAEGLGPCVDLFGFLPRPQAVDVLRRSRVSIVLAQNQDLQVPAKLYESLAAGLVTLVLTEPDSATARESISLGATVISPGDAEGLARIFGEVWSGTRQAPPAPLDLISYESLARRMGDRLSRDRGHEPSLFRGETAAPPEREGAATPAANWMWLAQPPEWHRALELVRDEPVYASAMRLHFREVLTERAGARGAGIARAVSLPYGDQHFDCVALFDAWSDETGQQTDIETVSDRPEILRECRRVLKAGGCLHLATDNTRWYRHLARVGRHASPRELRRALRRAGFARVETYYVTPAALRPFSVVPAHRLACLAHEQLQARVTLHSLARRGLAWLGLHEPLYQSLIFLAYR